MKLKIFYFFSLIIVALIAIEVSVRLLNLAPPITNADWNFVSDPYLPYKQRPFSIISGRSRSNEYDYEYQHNSEGFRDIDHTFEKPKNTFRILGIGDSFTYGQGVSFENTFLYILEKMLNEREKDSPKIEIIKAGIPRFFPEPERILLEQYGLKYSPDLILIGFVPNDVIDTFLGIDAVRVDEEGYLIPKEAKKIGKIGKWLYVQSHLCRIILRSYMSYKTKRREYKFPEIYKPEGYHERDWRKLESEFKKMIEIAKRAHVQIAFIHIPQGLRDSSYSYPAMRLSEFFSELGIVFIDVLEAMKEASRDQTLYWVKDGHCNSAGYRVIAETVYSSLIKEGLVP
jgi:lysophospholipase L1-like esterase